MHQKPDTQLIPVFCVTRICAVGLSVALLAGCGGGGNGSSTNNFTTTSEAPLAASSSSTSSSSASSLANMLTECELSNFKKDDTISYKLPILNGRCAAGNSEVEILVADKTYKLPLIDGYFKGVVMLKQGANEIRLSAGGKNAYTTINYQPSRNPKKVQMHYAIAAEDDGHFIAGPGEPNDMETAKKKLALEALMMQSGTAEMMYKISGKRITYTLVEDADGNPIINVLPFPYVREVLYTKTGEELADIMFNELTEHDFLTDRKNLVTMGFSDYRNGRNLAHTALGGLFGGFHLHTCPATIEEIVPAFSNTTLIDTRILPDDSNHRGTYWANCATGMGASLHELGHWFQYEHTPTGMMSRDLDFFSRLFVIEEPGYPAPMLPADEAGAVWDPLSYLVLSESEWFTPKP